MKKIKVRFNLGRGENYLKWKIAYPDGKCFYISPCDSQLIMKVCRLRNNKAAALRIFQGDEKVVCAWILCEEVEIKTDDFITESKNRLKYNPRVLPYWNINDKDVDGDKFKEIYSVDYGLYIK